LLGKRDLAGIGIDSNKPPASTRRVSHNLGDAAVAASKIQSMTLSRQ